MGMREQNGSVNACVGMKVRGVSDNYFLPDRDREKELGTV